MDAVSYTGPAVRPIQCDRLAAFPWLIHGFSTRSGGTTRVYGRPGDLNLGFTADDDRESVSANRNRFIESLGASVDALVTVRQVHSATTVVADCSAAPPEADGLITRESGLLLGIVTADCVPVLVVDPRTRSAGAFHAGWRGTVQQVVEKGVAQMISSFGSNPEDLLAAIGPSIGACCYQVGAEVLDAFTSHFPYAQELIPSKAHLDLREANRQQLMAAGLLRGNITFVGGCTSCNPDRYFSHRLQKGKTGRMLAVVGLRYSGSRFAAGV